MKKLFPLLLFWFLPWASTALEVPFEWKHSIGSTGTEFTLSVAPGHYIDPDGIQFELTSSAGEKITPQLKSASGKFPEKFTPGRWIWTTPAKGISGRIIFQGCADDGVCFMPQEYELPGAGHIAEKKAADDAGKYELVRKTEGYMDAGKFLEFLQNKSRRGFFGDVGIIGILLLTLLGGLGLNLTPCILPMVPVTLIILGAKGGGIPGLKRGLAYGAGMAIAYGILGLAAAFLGIGFGTLNSMPIFNFVIAGLFICMALAMAGVYNFNFASSLRQSVRTQITGGLTALLMGIVSALLAGACVAPVVISVLLFTAREYNTGNSWVIILPFVLGIGMALPWPFAGFGLKILPKPGKFMVAVKYLLAAVVAVMGIYYMSLGFRLLKSGKTAAAGESDGFAALENASAISRQTGRPLLIKFGASWCKNCHAMAETTFKDPEVVKILNENFVAVDFPAENPSKPRIKALLDAWQIPGFPAFVIARVKE